MPILPLLKTPQSYRPATVPLTIDNGGLAWWTGSATRVAENLIDHERQRNTPDLAERATAYTAAMAQLCQDILTEGRTRNDIDCYDIDQRFSIVSRKWGFDNAYADLKHRENEMAGALYPRHIEVLDSLNGSDLPLTLIKGVIAGNRFDLGCGEAIDDNHNNSPDFEQTLAELTPRPWRVDGYDAFAECFKQRPEKVMFFVDNVGADFILGCLPLARALADRGAAVVIAANSVPVVNDITASEAQDVVAGLTTVDEKLAGLVGDGRIKVIDSGAAEPLIDLTNLSAQCAVEATDTDLLILEGMGRALESNYVAEFTCATLKICLLKSQWVAEHFLDANVFDIVCRFEP